MIATAPGKLILTGEYAVLDGAPAVVVAVDRRVTARVVPSVADDHLRGRSPFLDAVAETIAARRGPDDEAVSRALRMVVDSRAFYEGEQKLGLGSSAAVTVATTALALGEPLSRDDVLEIALAAHAEAQGARGARGSGADIAASVHGGTIVFQSGRDDGNAPRGDGRLAERPRSGRDEARPRVQKVRWPERVMLVPFFTGRSADTARLVAAVTAARLANASDVDAALTAIAAASSAAARALEAPDELAVTAVVGALGLAAEATDRLARATGIELVPDCVRSARKALERLDGTAKTTGAGGGDIGVGIVPASADVTDVAAALIQAGCQPLRLRVDDRGVDLRTDAQ